MLLVGQYRIQAAAIVLQKLRTNDDKLSIPGVCSFMLNLGETYD